MERESSDEEEEDSEHLIEQNERSIQRSSFEIGEVKSRICRSFRLSKRCLLAIFLPLFLIILFFSSDFGRLFRNAYSVKFNSQSDRMRESELRALNLLKIQELGILHLWNQTLSYSKSDCGSNSSFSSPLNSNVNSTLNSTSVPSYNVSSITNKDCFPSSNLLEYFRFELRRQIKLNKEVQQTLLSSHQVGNGSQLLDYNADPAFGVYDGFGINRCRKVDQTAERRTIAWKPKSHRYLFAICTSGQMSNRLICLQKHMFFAALLDRVLILPSPKFDFQYERVLDINYINDCFGRKVVMLFEEFFSLKKNHVRIDRFICYMASPPCYVDEEHVKRLKALGLSTGKLEPAFPKDAQKKDQKKRDAKEITEKFSCNDEVLAIGDVFYADVEEEWLLQPGGPLAHKCKTIIQPNRLIMLTAQRFIQTFLGGNFIALHFRRHGFLQFCNAKKESCFFPIPQVAECILRSVQKSNAPVIYLSTDAANSETDLLQSLIVVDGRVVPLVKRPAHNSVEKWDALLFRKGLDSDAQAEAMLDKTICALSTVFIGSSGSTFTEDIIRLRRDWGSASICDEYICQGEHPNFQADLE